MMRLFGTIVCSRALDEGTPLKRRRRMDDHGWIEGVKCKVRGVTVEIGRPLPPSLRFTSLLLYYVVLGKVPM